MSRLNHILTEHFEACATATLQNHDRGISLDGVHFTVGSEDKTDTFII